MRGGNVKRSYRFYFFFIVSSAHVGFFHRSAGSRCGCSAIFCLSTSAVCGKLRLPVTTLLADTNFFFFFIQLRHFYSLKKLLEIVFLFVGNFKVMFLCGFVGRWYSTLWEASIVNFYFLLKSTTPLSEILFKVHPPPPCLKEDCYLGDAALCHAAKTGLNCWQVSNPLDDQHGETHTTISTHSVILLVKILGVAAENPRRPNTTCKLHQDNSRAARPQC